MKHLEFVNYTPKVKYWRYMENFCFLPTIYTAITGTMCEVRVVYFHWLGIMAGVEWVRNKKWLSSRK